MSGSESRRRVTAPAPAGMTRDSADGRRKQDELASELRHIAEEIRPLTDSIDSLYLLLQHVWQNREELYAILHASDQADGDHGPEDESLPPETLFCTGCDTVAANSLARALRAGWQCIIDDEGNKRGNYAGMCPGCIAEEEGHGLPVEQNVNNETPSEVSGGQKRLF